MPPISETERDLNHLEAELKRLEAEYTMYFSGRLPKPPWETRSRVDGLIKRYDRAYIQNYGDRFRFQMLQTRYAKFIDLWDRGLRAREEGRSGPFIHTKAPGKGEAPPKAPENRVLCVSSFSDPAHEEAKLHKLYDSLTEARREVGEDTVPFHKFAELVKTQVSKLKPGEHGEVAFRVAVKDGKVNFTARALKGLGD
jgi:hypothetical protein